MMDDKQNQLDLLLDGLNDSIQPERDLWPDIEAALTPKTTKRDGFWQWRVAASVAITVAMGGLLAGPWPGGGTEVAEVETITLPSQDIESLQYSGFDAEYMQVREQSMEALVEQLEELSPETRGVILGHLTIIRGSINEINAAIEREPNNVQLRQLLQLAYRQELAILSSVRNGTTTIDKVRPTI